MQNGQPCRHKNGRLLIARHCIDDDLWAVTYLSSDGSRDDCEYLESLEPIEMTDWWDYFEQYTVPMFRAA